QRLTVPSFRGSPGGPFAAAGRHACPSSRYPYPGGSIRPGAQEENDTYNLCRMRWKVRRTCPLHARKSPRRAARPWTGAGEEALVRRPLVVPLALTGFALVGTAPAASFLPPPPP